ncbi:chromosome alignment-maintaining phosphoprotein 1 [Amia ocellicauda]|uniref:chromosome alignment-maintaining phosphoprotein 1 n=1 Tax=Amia ocellicauda TaxID=2972642 RepID=UPI00346396A5
MAQKVKSMEAHRQMFNAGMNGHLQCAFCSYQCVSNETFQIHMGTYHPVHCDEIDVGRLGKVIIYQRSAKLYHCKMCFFTGKTYARVYDHVIVSHSFSGHKNIQAFKIKTSENGELKEHLSDDNEDKEVSVKEPPKAQIGDGKGEHPNTKPGATNQDYLNKMPAKFTPLNSTKNEDEGSDEDEDSLGVGAVTTSLKRKRNSDEEQPPDDEDFPDYSPGGASNASSKQLEQEESKDNAQAEEEFLSKYVRRNVGRYYCKICNWRGKMKGFVLYHVSRKHNIPKPYACKECHKSFFLESLLNNHISLHHKQGLYKCPYCPFESNFLRGIRKHLKHCSSQQGEARDNEPWDSDEHMDEQE